MKPAQPNLFGTKYNPETLLLALIETKDQLELDTPIGPVSYQVISAAIRKRLGPAHRDRDWPTIAWSVLDEAANWTGEPT